MALPGQVTYHDSFILKFSKTGQYLGQIGHANGSKGSMDNANDRGVAQIRLGEGPRGPATSYPVLFLDVYALRNGVWQMVAWQATRPGE